MSSDAKYKPIHGKGLKILTSKQMLQRLPIWLPIILFSYDHRLRTCALAHVKTGKTCEKVLNEIREIMYSLYRAKEVTK